jgi:hypothetical protein
MSSAGTCRRTASDIVNHPVEPEILSTSTVERYLCEENPDQVLKDSGNQAERLSLIREAPDRWPPEMSVPRRRDNWRA